MTAKKDQKPDAEYGRHLLAKTDQDKGWRPAFGASENDPAISGTPEAARIQQDVIAADSAAFDKRRAQRATERDPNVVTFVRSTIGDVRQALAGTRGDNRVRSRAELVQIAKSAVGADKLDAASRATLEKMAEEMAIVYDNTADLGKAAVHGETVGARAYDTLKVTPPADDTTDLGAVADRIVAGR